MSDMSFAQKLANAPWLCAPEYVEFMHGILVRHLERQDAGLPLDRRAIEAATGRPMENTRSMTQRDGVARIPVEGPIFRRANLFTELSGAVSCGQLAKDFASAHDDPTVHSILLVFDSPGGEVTGINELAGMIRQKRDLGQKRIEAYVDGDCASAAYWLASATSKITADATASLGSIGVVSRVSNPDALGKRDTLEFWSRSSPKKRMDFRSYEGQDAIQRYVDTLADVFVAAVADNRGVTAEKVEEDFGQGFVLVGAQAVEAGLADALGSEEEVMASLVARARNPAPARDTATTPAASAFDLTINEERLGALAAAEPSGWATPANNAATTAHTEKEDTAMTEKTERAQGGASRGSHEPLPSPNRVEDGASAGTAEAPGLFRRLGAALGFTVVEVAAEDQEGPEEDHDEQSTDDGEGDDAAPSGESDETEDDADDEGEETDDAMTQARNTEAGTTDGASALTTDERAELERLRAAKEETDARNEQLSATLKERGIDSMLGTIGSVELENGKRGVMPPAQRRAAKAIISELDAAGAGAVELSAGGTATLADNDAGRALGNLLTPWRPQETGERGTASGEGPADADGETPEGEIHALMDKEGISYREAAIKLSSKEVN